MLLSVIVYNHQLTFGQWLGAAVVFAGISVEAFVKRKGLSDIFPLRYHSNLFPRRPRKTSHTGEGKGQVKIVIT